MFEKIFVPTDFSAPAENALAMAINIAKKFDSRITLLHVCETPAMAYVGMMTVDLITPLQDAAREALQQAADSLKARHAASESQLLLGVASMELVAAIEKQKPDLVVMGTHGRTGVSHLLLGSVAERLVRLSSAPVLTVRHSK